ncbi:MAG: hypothetical protein E6G74_00115 [Alphaproteobacteria bacterium]|nr:MAG: hypothetical protein E6G74_00115 [Alphaproteobacteria bacterium]
MVVVKLRALFRVGVDCMPGERMPFRNLVRLAITLGPLLIGCLSWVSYRHFVPSAGQSKVAIASTSSSKSLETAPIDAPASERLRDAQSAVTSSVAPLRSLSLMTAPVDSDPVTSFRQLIALPPDTARAAPHVDPRKLRAIADRGVVGYANAKTDGERARAAGLIQTAALVGLPLARELLARNYPQSEAVRSVVPANDAIRYATGSLMDAGITSEDSNQVFLALGQYFASQGQLDLFAGQIINSLRGDSRSQLGHRIDILLDLLARVPGACSALARIVPGTGDPSDQECSSSFSEKLRKHIETITPAGEEEESKRRGLVMLNHLGGR